MKEQIDRCVCERCGFSMPAPKGVDCSQVRCPKCGSAMRTGSTAPQPLQ
ncbi:hypothetical protein GF336_06440 [Candidatus Woesearchaeota archaeon]|nr:hypothetical protein [Candidatus Woesearchaeota archaeon]